VINAFRHQRFLHNDAPVEIVQVTSDQRLSASKIFAQGERSPEPSVQERVINAFRHQRFLHISNKKVWERERIVINAFRHQRFLHMIWDAVVKKFARDQRLSASKIFAPRHAWLVGTPTM